MKFALKYFYRETVAAVKGIAWFFIFMMGLGVIAFITMEAEPTVWGEILRFMKCVFLPSAAWLGMILIFSALIIAGKCKVYEILDERGFCLEYFYAYEATYIKGKPKNDRNYIEFAEIYQQMGDYDGAISVLNTINLASFDAVNDYTAKGGYIIVYLKSAIGLGNVAFAEEIYNRHKRYINSLTLRIIYKSLWTELQLTMAKLDCLNRRYEKALETCERFIRRRQDKLGEFRILKVFILKRLGRETEYSLALMDAQKAVGKAKPTFDSTKRALFAALSKAAEGEMTV